jgi:multisubunit Na+/H+ antiporter MnhG subunit
VLFAVLSILEFLFFGGQSDSTVVASTAWFMMEVAYILAATLLILGLVGLYLLQARPAGRLGLVAFLAALTGTLMLAGTDWSAAFFGPWLAEAAPDLLVAEPAGTMATGIILTLVLFALGWFLFGLASLRAGVLPRGSALLLIVGAVLALVLAFLELPFEVVLLGAAAAWMGYALWSRAADQPSVIAEAAM